MLPARERVPRQPSFTFLQTVQHHPVEERFGKEPKPGGVLSR